MKNLLSGLRRWSLDTESAVAGRIEVLTRAPRTVRKAPRARLGLEFLEKRELMSGLSVNLPVAGPDTPPDPAPPITAILTATAHGSNQVELNWTDGVEDPVQTVAQEWNGTAWSTVCTLSGDPQICAIGNLSGGTTYQFRVSIAGYGEQTSNTATVTTCPILVGSPSLTWSAASATGADLDWTSVPGAVAYTIEWQRGTSFFPIDPSTQTMRVSSSVTAYPITGLAPSTSYAFELVANNGPNAYDGNLSNVVIVTTMPPPPTLTPMAISSTQINLSWNSVPGATGYVIDNVASGTPVPMANVGTSLSDSLLGLNPDTDYQLEVARSARGAWNIRAWCPC